MKTNWWRCLLIVTRPGWSVQNIDWFTSETPEQGMKHELFSLAPQTSSPAVINVLVHIYLSE